MSPAKHSFGKCDRRTDRRTDRRRTKLSLCVAMLRRRHKKEMSDIFLKIHRSNAGKYHSSCPFLKIKKKIQKMVKI